MEAPYPIEGGCTCREVRYRLKTKPLFVHCCHCRWCEREIVYTPSNSGKGQKIVRCPTCRVAVWSHYSGAGDVLSFIRVGTLDDPDRLPPDIHIFTSSKQPWVVLDPATPAVAEYYARDRHWPAASLERRRALLASLGTPPAGR